jgi:hypothetical protein
VSAYVDYGPARIHPKGHGILANGRYLDRPYCDLCGVFRSRRLRKIGRDEFGDLHRCESCDLEA